MAKLDDVNTTDLRAAAELGCRTMCNVFNADDDNIAFFSSLIRPETRLASNDSCTEAHIPGRHLNGLLEAEDVFGIVVDDASLGYHRHAAMLSFGGPAVLCMNRPEPGAEATNFCPHNCREGFHALYALILHRDDDEAKQIMERNIATIFDLWTPEDRWDEARLKKLGITFQPSEGFIASEARAIGPLVKLHRATGYAPALELATVFKEKAIKEFYLADGSYDAGRFGTRHAHSVTCVMSGLALLAEWTNDAPLLGRVKTFYDRGLWDMRDEVGWSAESAGQEGTDHGETNNSGDILETAIILGHAGYTRYYEDAERIIRGHLLPSQLRDNSFIEDPPNPDNIDGKRNVADRHLGAWGFPAPYGHVSMAKGRTNLSFNMDIVGGTTASLCEATRHCVITDGSGTWVNMLFDHETDAVKIESCYTHEALRVTMKQPGALWVRMPSWVDRAALKIDGAEGTPRWANDYLYFAGAIPGKAIELKYPLAVTETALNPRVHVHPIRVRMEGDAVAAIDNFGMELTFFDPYE
ncbi:MAG: hypothetical protein CMJ49_09490 [Planctomycetaceae bacterium]|nr:hypothetical protein [Planctomycetaceae bacterium]